MVDSSPVVECMTAYPEVRGSNPELGWKFQRCFSVSPTSTRLGKSQKNLSVKSEVSDKIANSPLSFVTRSVIVCPKQHCHEWKMQRLFRNCGERQSDRKCVSSLKLSNGASDESNHYHE